jgi:hypothetical protein
MRNIRRPGIGVAGLSFLFVFGLACLISWCANIVKLFGLAQATDPNIVMAVLRAGGIFFAPRGVILGLM